MTEAFLKIVNMSISAGWLVLAVLVLRFALKKAPKWVSVLLWGIVAVRLICPFSIESALSLIPSRETISPEIMMDWTPEITTGIAPLDQVVNPVISTSLAPDPGASANPLQILIPMAANLWLLGVLVMLAYTAITYLRLRRKLTMATILRENIFQCETVRSPFVLGILKPRIYLPYGMDGNDLHHVVAHEQAHIRRKDHWWKPLGFLLLTVYWFNPLMWVAYILLCRDIELACDEKVIAQLGNEQRADYTQALVACSVNRRMIAACPLAFGEVGVKDRVKSILNYRKPTFWVIVTALVLSAVVAVCFLTDPNPSREFSMKGRNVTDLEPEAIVERILDIEDWESSNVYVNADNFDVTVDSDFNWVYSQAVRYFFTDAKHTYSAQLRIFTEDGKYFLTEPIEWVEEEREFLLRYYLEALKYLPEDEIRQMAPADQYSIYLVDFQDAESNDQRTITYSKENGVGDIDGWYIHLRVEPLHAEADGQGYHGYGSEVIDLYYGDGNLSDNLPIFGGELHLGLNAEIIEIDYEDEIMVVKDVDKNADVFGDRCLIDCSWASSCYNLMYVDYSQYNNIQTIGFEDFQVGDQVIIGLYDNQKQTAYNGTAVAEQVQLATQRLNTQMQPTETNLRGFYGGYLFTNFNGATYRYAMTEVNPQSVTADQLLLTFSEETPIEGIAWEVYSLKEYPDGSKVLAISGTNSAWLCEYAPAQRAAEGALEAARAAGYVIVEDGYLTDGRDIWDEFFNATQKGVKASIRVAQYYTLDPDRTVATTYEAYKQDYPALHIDEITYDGEKYILHTESGSQTYEYLMKYDASRTPLIGEETHGQAPQYALTNDEYPSWDVLLESLASSMFAERIAPYIIGVKE